jgi:hypothetical protein
MDDGVGMERDPFDKETYESPIFDDSRNDRYRVFGILDTEFWDRLVSPARGAPYQFIGSGISLLITGIVLLAATIGGFLVYRLWVGFLLGSAFLVIGIAMTMIGVVALRKDAKTR